MGLSLGPIVGGVLSSSLSWRWAFGVNAAVAVVAVAGGLLLLSSRAGGSARRGLDPPGAALAGSALVLLVGATSAGPEYGWFRSIVPLVVAQHEIWAAGRLGSLALLMIAAALAGLVAFLRAERRLGREDRDPLLDLGQFRQAGYRNGTAIAALQAMAHYGLLFVVPLLLQDGRGLTPISAAVWQLPTGVAVVVWAPIGGWIANRFVAVVALRIGLAVQAVALAVLAVTVAADGPLFPLAIGLGMFGAGVGMAGGQLNNVVMQFARSGREGMAGAVNTTARQIGSAFGVAVTGAVVVSLVAATTTGSVQHAIDLAAAARISCWIGVGFAAASAVVALAILRPAR